jgi:hypothetical protein
VAFALANPPSESDDANISYGMIRRYSNGAIGDMFARARAAGVNAASARRTFGSIPGKGAVPGAAGDNPTGESIDRSEIAIWAEPTPIS